MRLQELLVCSVLTAIPASLPGAQDCGNNWGYCHLSRWTSGGGMNGVGRAVAMDGDTAAVRGYTTATQILERAGASWTATQFIPAPSAGSNTSTRSLALEGDTLVIGAPGEETHAQLSGGAYVYERVNGVFELQQTLYSSAPTSYGQFGWNVALDGDWLAISEPAGDAERISFYLRTLTGWELATVLDPGIDGFGLSFAMRAVPGEASVELFVGNWSAPQGADSYVGEVYAYTVWPGGGLYHGTLKPAGLEEEDVFGMAVEWGGDTLFVSARGDDDSAGAVYVFDAVSAFASPATATVQQKLTPCDVASDVGHPLYFGGAMDTDGERLVVGAIGADVAGTDDAGSVYVYWRDPFSGLWAIEDRIVAADGADTDRFGVNMAVQDDLVLVGASLVDVSETASGAAYFTSLSPGIGWSGQCPCDALAGLEHFGTGKPGSNGVPLLTALSNPVAGKSHVVSLKNALIGAQPVLVWGLFEGSSGFDGGELLIADPHLIALPTVGVLGQVGVGWSVPDDPAACGLDVFAQAFFIDPGAAGPLHTAQSNGLRLTIGY